MIGAFEGDDVFFAGGEQGGFERGFDGFETGVAEDGFDAPAFPAFEGEFGKFAGELALEWVRAGIGAGSSARIGVGPCEWI